MLLLPTGHRPVELRIRILISGSFYITTMEQSLDIFYKRRDIYVKEQARMAKSAISEANKAFELLMEISQNPSLLKEFEEFKRNALSQENPQKKAAKAHA